MRDGIAIFKRDVDCGRDVARFSFLVSRTILPSTRHSGPRGQGGNVADPVANVVPVFLSTVYGSAMAPTWPERFGPSNPFWYFLILLLPHRVLDDGSDQSRLEVDDAFARCC